MKQRFLNGFPILIALAVLILLPTMVHAQVDPGGDAGAPIDGGASIVAAACAGYLAKRKKRNRK